VLVIHQEGDGGAVRAAAKAMVKLLHLANGERGCFFVVKRAAGLELATSFFQRHARVDDLNNICAVENFVDKRLGDTAEHVSKIKADKA
jgi:hypothetical protein